MNSLKGFRLINVCPRYLHTGLGLCQNQKNIAVVKQSQVMNKLMNLKAKAKRKWYETPVNTLPTMKTIAKTSQTTGKQGAKRAAMLNKMFMKNISDLLCTGSLSQDILGRGLEISKVEITCDYQILRVYWVADKDEHKELETLLQRTAGVLKHELSQLRLMGQVPTIMFVKDDRAARMHEMDSRLAQADYGDDYVPKTIGHLLKTDFTLNKKLSPEIMEKIHKLENEIITDDDPIPEMTHSVYGLDHQNITNRLRGARKVNEDAWGRLNHAAIPQDNVVSYRASDGPKSTYDFDEQKKNLTEFLEKRQIQQDRMHKNQKRLSRYAERNVVFELQEDREKDHYEEEEIEYYDEEDNDFHDDTSTTSPSR